MNFKPYMPISFMAVTYFFCGNLGAMLFGSSTFIDLLFSLEFILALFVLIPIEVYQWFKSKFSKKKNIELLLKTLLVVVVSVLPYRSIEVFVRGKPDYKAWYEGTQNQATLTLRDNGKFDIHWTGVFFSSSYYKGVYSLKNGELIFEFDGEPPRDFNGRGYFSRRKHLKYIELESDMSSDGRQMHHKFEIYYPEKLDESLYDNHN